MFRSRVGHVVQTSASQETVFVITNFQNVLIDQKHLQVQLQYAIQQAATVTN
jgi:hypothetical protein